jgi:hypothetical protein
MPSTVIRSYLYDPTKSELWITFVSGRRYIYTDVPQPVFDAFKAAPSRGTFFNLEIRGHYAYRELPGGGSGSGGHGKRRDRGG